MLKFVRSAALLGLGLLVAPLGAQGFQPVSDLAISKLDRVSADCSLAARNLLSESCTDTFLVEFSSAAAQVEFDAERDAELAASFSSLTLSAYELNGQELGLLEKSPDVVKIVENTEFSIAGTQSDAPWQLDRIEGPAASYDATYSYDDAQTGAGVTIYIVDTGINTSHIEFTGRTATGYSSIGSSTDTLDCNGHGTHVAALAAGSVFGAAKNATVVPVRVLDCDGSGTLLGVLQGLDWIANNTQVGQPAVVNMSLGGDRNTYLDDAIGNLTSQGLAFVVAAGNTGVDASLVSPAASPGAITVGASDRTDVWAYFSNYGSEVDITAPGVDVRSAWYAANNATAVASGTSMAAAVVSGVVANQMSYGYQTPAALLSALQTNAVAGVLTSVPANTANLLLQDTVAFSSGTSSSGGALADVTVPADTTPIGIVDPIQPAPTTPSNPTAPLPATYAQPTVVVGGQNATVNWTIAEQPSDLTGQVVKLYSGTTEIQSFDLDASVTTLVISELAPGVVYRVAVAGVNEVGTGTLSPQSEPFEVSEQIFGPEGGEFSAWVKKISDTQVKFYAKYPQIGDKIQFMVQQPNGVYKEIAWLRVTDSRVDENGEYIGLQNRIYFIRTIDLRDGKNRLRIMLNGELLDRTRTYTL